MLQHYRILCFVSKILCPGMSLTCLNVQEDKSEIIHFSSRFSPANSVPTIKVGDCSVTPHNKVKDLGDKLVCHLTFKFTSTFVAPPHILFTTSEKLWNFYLDVLRNVLSYQCICFFNTWFLQQHSSRPSLLQVREITTVVLVFDNSGCCNL